MLRVCSVSLVSIEPAFSVTQFSVDFWKAEM